MTPDPAPPGRGPAQPATVPLTKEPDPAGRDVPGGERGSGHRTRRPWSARRVPATLVAAVILVAAVAALADVIAVRAGRPAAAWRRHLADALATRPVDDVWMLTGAAVAAAVGVWLIVLALTPVYAAGCPAPPRRLPPVEGLPGPGRGRHPAA
ncbi:hypothetical protein ACFQ3Z_24065 [Streptomyces nogalater]